jgi:MFS family permease
LLALLVGLGVGRFAYPPLIPALVEHRWFSVAQADYLGAVNLGGYVLGALAASYAGHRLRPATVIRWAMLATGFSYLVCFRPLGFAWFFFWRMVAGAAGAALMVFGPPSILARTPPARRGWVGGLIFAGVGTGIMLTGTVIPALLARGLPFAWLALGTAAVVVAAATWNVWAQTAPPPAAAVTRGHRARPK